MDFKGEAKGREAVSALCVFVCGDDILCVNMLCAVVLLDARKVRSVLAPPTLSLLLGKTGLLKYHQLIIGKGIALKYHQLVTEKGLTSGLTIGDW